MVLEAWVLLINNFIIMFNVILVMIVRTMIRLVSSPTKGSSASNCGHPLNSV